MLIINCRIAPLQSPVPDLAYINMLETGLNVQPRIVKDQRTLRRSVLRTAKARESSIVRFGALGEVAESPSTAVYVRGNTDRPTW